MIDVEYASLIFSLLLLSVIMSLTFGIMWSVLYSRAARARGLQATQGKLGDISFYRVTHSKGPAYWSVRLSYRYTVLGVAYSGHRLGLGFNSYDSKAEAFAALGTLQPNTTITVWYDPYQPKWSALDKTTPPKSLRTFGYIGLGSVAVGLLASAVIAYHWAAWYGR